MQEAINKIKIETLLINWKRKRWLTLYSFYIKIFKPHQKKKKLLDISYFIHRVNQNMGFQFNYNSLSIVINWHRHPLDDLFSSEKRKTTLQYETLFHYHTLSFCMMINWNVAAPTKAKGQIDHQCHKTCCLSSLLWPCDQSFGTESLALKWFGKVEPLLLV